MSLFSIIMAGSVTFSLALGGSARQQLKVYTTIKIPKAGLQLLIFNIIHFNALEKRPCAIV